MKKRRLIAVVPARAGSKGLRKKNQRVLGGKPLFEWSYSAGCLMGIETYVSTDDVEIINYCTKHNLKFIERPASISGDSSRDFEFLHHLISELNIRPNGSSIVNLRPTSPLRTRADLKKFKNLVTYTDGSIRSVEKSDFPVQKMWFKSENGQLESVIDFKGVEHYNLPRQELQQSYKQTGSFDSYRVEDIHDGKINGDKIFSFEQSIHSYDIDTLEDFIATEKFYHQNRELFDY